MSGDLGWPENWPSLDELCATSAGLMASAIGDTATELLRLNADDEGAMTGHFRTVVAAFDVGDLAAHQGHDLRVEGGRVDCSCGVTPATSVTVHPPTTFVPDRSARKRDVGIPAPGTIADEEP